MIREFQISDTEQVMKLWLFGNIDAHSFVPEEYWRLHFNEVQETLLEAKVFVYDIDEKVLGFIGLMNEYIAGIFVDKSCRSAGIGMQLLTYVKQKYDTLSLSVYQQNSRAVAFCHREGFSILSEGIDEDTGEKEYTMFWKKSYEK
ncbi:MAG TPA: N-acetyltransferase [Candidatus Blautia excrementipullorum]|nr:N-acetyltransferase [Candidatus Blautia excrementipullorum]